MEFSQWLVIEDLTQIITSVLCEMIEDEQHAEVIARAKTGDEQALSDLYVHWMPEALAKVSHEMGKSRKDSDVEDVASEVLARLVTKIKNNALDANTAGEIGNWIETSTKRLLVDRYRELSRMRPRDPEDIFKMASSKDTTSGVRGRAGTEIFRPGRSRFKTPDVYAMSNERNKELEKAVDSLEHPTERAVARMALAGVGHEDIAKRLTLSFNPILQSHWIFEDYFAGLNNLGSQNARCN